jgi:hypothetical protein
VAGRLGQDCSRLWRKAELEERLHWSLNVASAARRRKTAQPRKWLTAKRDRGTHKHGTSPGGTLNERLIPRGRQRDGNGPRGGLS